MLNYKKIGPFIYHEDLSLGSLCSNYDHVIGLLNIRCLDIMSLLFRPRCYKLSLWGIGVSASYTKSFDEQSIVSKIRNVLAMKADSLIFYTEYPVERFIKAGYSSKRIFVAHNTVDNVIEYPASTRDKFIFIGTLYHEKGIVELIDQYYIAYKKLNGEIFDLNIVVVGICSNNSENKFLDMA